jgi:beta-glucosidase
MSGYNKINAEYAGGNNHLLNDVLKGAWGYTTFTVTNTDKREGADAPQLYLTEAAGEKRMRLLGFERVELKPGETRTLTITADPRLLARFDGKAGKWSIAEGAHQVAVGKSAADLVLKGDTRLSPRQFGV